MVHYKTETVTALGSYVAMVINSIDGWQQEWYPVLGAEGGTFFIEIASGPLLSRRIIKTVHVELNRRHKAPVLEYDPAPGNDTLIMLPDASFLIAFAGLFQSALRAKTLILHPLSENGDFLPGWSQATIAASLRKIS